jgi:hypothetical protein
VFCTLTLTSFAAKGKWIFRRQNGPKSTIAESHDLVRLYVERELELYLSYLMKLIQDTGRTHARSALQQRGLRPVVLEELAHLIR